tara:strand:- start:4957 stop:5136 length:180 start_codon:yes stop_codon:yes gene_type:complete
MIGQLVVVRLPDQSGLAGKIGVVLDEMEMSTGFSMYEILIDGTAYWLEDLDLGAVFESR